MKKDKDFNFKINEDKGLEFTINTKIYSLASIYQAAYLFLDRVYVFLDGEPKDEIMVVMKLKGSSFVPQSGTTEDLAKIANEFYNELLNQLLREKVSETNAKIREYIVAQALYNAVPNEVDELLKEVEEEDWQEDPLGIAKTWEETQNEKGSPLLKASDGKGKRGKTGKKKKRQITKSK